MFEGNSHPKFSWFFVEFALLLTGLLGSINTMLQEFCLNSKFSLELIVSV